MKQKKYMKLLLACTVALLATASAVHAQSPIINTQPATPNDPVFGQLGSNYAEADVGYLHHTDGPPGIAHDYDLTLNQNVYQQGITGLDAQLGYSYLDANNNSFAAHRQVFDLGAVGYLSQSWGKPFLAADVGWADQRAAGVSTHSYTYDLGAGVEFQLLRQLVISPELTYDATPKLTTPGYALGLSNYEWNYGAKATYRITKQVSATLGVFADQNRDMTYRVGLGFHY